MEIIKAEGGVIMRPRIERLKQRYLEAKPHLDIERAVLVTKAYRENEDKPIVLRSAKALETVLLEMSIQIHPDEFIVGDIAKLPRSVNIFPEVCGGWLEKELDLLRTRSWDPLIVSEEDKHVLRTEVFPYWRGKSVDERVFTMLPKETKDLCYADPEAYPPSGTAILQNRNQTTSYVGNVYPNYKTVLQKGFNGIIAEVQERLEQLDPAQPKDLEKIHFLQAVLCTSRAAIAFARRYAEEAGRLSQKERDPQRKRELNKIAEIARTVPGSPARTYHEALQCLWFIHLITRLSMNGNAFALGRLDQLLFPYYQSDLASGELSREDALELLECFFVKVASVNILRATSDAKFFGGYAIWNLITLGGQTRDGKDATNEISYLCLEAMQELQLPQPDIVIRLHGTTPREFYLQSIKLLRLGLGHPKYQSDEIIVPYMLERGIPLDEAREYVLTACVEARPEKEGNYLTAIYLNLGAPLELVFNRGVLKFNQRKIGIDTGDPLTFMDFNQFREAYQKQLAHLCRHAAIASGVADIAKREMLAAPFLSSMRGDCIDRAQDLWKYGASYNDGGGYWSAVGVADSANSLAAVKKLVFEEKKITLQQLKEAMDKDFEGFEPLRQMLLNRAPKWGNDDDYVDSLAEWVLYTFAEECHKYRNGLGAKYQPEVTTLTANIPFGTVLGALPSGRKAGMPLTDGISPEPNSEKIGVIGAIRSASKLFRMAKIVGTLHNMKFSPFLLQDDRGMENFVSLLKTYLVDYKGWHSQFNVVSAQMLKDAQRHPENYPHLIVKVAGYSAYFAELDRSLQDEIIARTEYACI